VELRPGESLAIGGLFQHSAQTDISQIPGLGSIPILSALFRSTRYQRNETELLIIVTPRIVTQSDIDHDKDRNLSGVEPDIASFLLTGNALDKPMARDLRGPIEPDAHVRPIAQLPAAKKPAVALAAASMPAASTPVAARPATPIPVAQAPAAPAPIANLRRDIQSSTLPLLTAPVVPASGK